MDVSGARRRKGNGLMAERIVSYSHGFDSSSTQNAKEDRTS